MDEGLFSVLVAEDEKLIADNIAKSIENANPLFKVVSIVSNGEDALRYVQNSPPHVVFTDIWMPVMDGIELIKSISKEFRFVKCVIVSGYDEFSYAKDALRYGAHSYLLKPINHSELAETLEQIALELSSEREKWYEIKHPNTLSAKEIVAQMKEYIHNSYYKAIDIGTIAQSLSFSASYLTKIFAKYENITPSKYLQNYRINRAKQLLADRSLSINMVANAVGYQDPFHFSKSFKRITGQSPATYRKRLLNSESHRDQSE